MHGSILRSYQWLIFFPLVLFSISCGVNDQSPSSPEIKGDLQDPHSPLSVLSRMTTPATGTVYIDPPDLTISESLIPPFPSLPKPSVKIPFRLDLAPNPSGPNLGPQATPTASSWWNEAESWLGFAPSPNKAIDNNRTTYWLSKYWRWYSWYRLDWPQPIDINRIYSSVEPGSPTRNNSITSIKYLSEIGTWVTIPNSTFIYGGYGGRPRYFDLNFPTVKAKAILINLTPDWDYGHPNWVVTFRELEVYGLPTPPATLDITEPADGAIFDEGTAIVFKAQGTNVSGLSWKTNYPPGTDLGSGPEISVDSLATNQASTLTNHVITVSGTTQLGNPISKSITVKILRLQEIKIQSNGTIADTYPVGYQAAKTPFNALGVFADNSEKSVSPIWSLLPVSGQPSSQDSMRAKILTALNQDVNRPAGISNIPSKNIATLCDALGICGVEDTLPSPKVSAVSLVSFLSGQIKLKASLGAVSKEVTIQVKQPTVYISFKKVTGARDIFMEWVQFATSVWSQENLVHIKIRDGENPPNPISEIENFSFELNPLPHPSGEPLLSEPPSFFNPIAFDVEEIKWFAPLLGANYYPAQVVMPRQCWELFQLKRSYSLDPLDLTRKTDINVFITYKVYAVYPVNDIMDDYLQVAATLDNDPIILGFSKRDNYERIDNREYSGIIISLGEFLTSPHPLSSLETDLAHETGHIIMGIGDEHNSLGSTEDSTENLMGLGRKLNELQFLAAFDYKKQKTENQIMMVEE